MTYTQKLPITTLLKSPYVVTIAPISSKTKCKRKTFKCGYAACQYLKDQKLDPIKFYGGDVADNTGKIVAELE